MCSVLSDSVRRSVVIALCYFFIVFGSLLFAKHLGEYVIKNNGFLNDSNMASSDFNENMMPKT